VGNVGKGGSVDVLEHQSTNIRHIPYSFLSRGKRQRGEGVLAKDSCSWKLRSERKELSPAPP